VQERWSEEQATQWFKETPWLVGCNFTPSTAGNQLEMWQLDTFDLETIERELGWAASIGMNSVRVFLHNLLWSSEGTTYLDRIDAVLDVCAKHGISMMPVLFDGVWNPFPSLGPQPQPKPGVHNSVWVQGPGAEILHDPSEWPELRRYVEAVIGRFGNDPRICLWDLFNEPAQHDYQTLRDPELFVRKQAAVDELVREVFTWARGVGPAQPLTVGLYGDLTDPADPASGINATALDFSDIVTFHSYDPAAGLQNWITGMVAHGRGAICTEWLARSAGSTVDLLELMATHRVGAYNWGLVDGKTQTKYPWSSWWEPVSEDEAWFHELFHADGTPYDAEEVAVFRALANGHR